MCSRVLRREVSVLMFRLVLYSVFALGRFDDVRYDDVSMCLNKIPYMCVPFALFVPDGLAGGPAALQVDLDGNGLINFAEFVTMMRKCKVDTDFDRQIREAFKVGHEHMAEVLYVLHTRMFFGVFRRSMPQQCIPEYVGPNNNRREHNVLHLSHVSILPNPVVGVVL